jgi:integrase
MKLQDSINVFLSTYRNSTTRATYAYSLHKMADYVGNRPVADIRPLDLIGYIASLTNREGVPLSPNSINKEIKTCRVFFNWLVKSTEIPSSPMKPIPYQSIPRHIDREKAMPDDDLTKILDRVKFMPRENALIRFLADTGARAGGVAHLKLSDVDLANCTAIITEKGDKQRMVAFGKSTATAIRQWLNVRKGTTDFIFQKGNRSFSAEAVGSMVRRCCLLAGVTPRQSHSLRHRKGHQLADANVPPTVAATVLGHESPLITMKHYYPQDTARALAALRDLTLDADDEATAPPPNVIKLMKNNAG